VRHSIEAHLLDSSSAVRDAAVELIGKYIVESPQLADKYYKQVADRIQVCDSLFMSSIYLIYWVGYWAWGAKTGSQAIQITL
jgi:hypothetical protein